MDTRLTGNHPESQRGVVTLAIGILLLLLITLMTLYGARVGLMEQRVSANEYRAKLAHGAGEAGRNNAVEFLNAHLEAFNSEEDEIFLEDGTTIAGWRSAGNDRWGDAVELDCSAPAPGHETAACNAGMTGFVFYYRNPNDPSGGIEEFDVFPAGDNTSDRVSVNEGREGDEVRVSYNADYVLCPLDVDMNATPPTLRDPPCTEDIDSARYFGVLVRSEGYLIDSEGNRIDLDPEADGFQGPTAEVAEVVVKFDLFGAGPRLPLTVGGTFPGSGGFNIVANPNGGPAAPGGGRSGAPFSVWSKGDYTMDGNTITCQRYEFFASNPDENDTFSDTPPNDTYEVCYKCNCPNEVFYQLSSGTSSGDKGEGMDIVDDDPDFPDDLFYYTFGVPREDRQILKDMAQIISSTHPDAKYASCDDLKPEDSGLFWSEEDCKIQNKTGGIGTPHRPVVLISEGYVTMNADAKMFGVVYVYENGMKLNGGAQIYGAVVGDPPPGEDFDGSGTGDNAIIYDQQVLNRVAISPDFQRVAPLPGTWTDGRAAP